jgi:DNA-binding CsgD family transcriptional regulator
MDHWVSDLTSRLLGAQDIAAAQRAFRRLAAEAGVERFAYALVDGRRGLHVDTTYPEAWTTHYLANGYQNFDPVVLESRHSRLPFAWRFVTNRPGLTADQSRLFAEASDFGIRDGMTIPFHGGGKGFGILSLAFESNARLREVMAAQPRMRLLGIYYHTAVERLLEAERDDADVTNGGDDGYGGLAPHERQCLSRLADGQSLWDISAALHLPETSVRSILRAVRERLGATTTADAIAKATARRWIG